MGRLRIGIAQQNCTVGDLEGNFARIAEVMELAEAQGVRLLCFPELSLTGYPAEDLALNMDFVAHNLEYLEKLGALARETVSVVGFIDRDEDCFNAAAVLHRGGVAGVYHKSFLPNYGVFDENRYFSPGRGNLVLKLDGVRVGLTVCEDIWSPGGPLEEEIAYGGAEVIVNISASPFNRGKQPVRERTVQSRAQDGQVILVYANAVGGQDELVFDGRSFVYHPDKGIILRGPAFEEALLTVEVDTDCLQARRFLRPIHRYMRQGAPIRPTEVLEIPGQREAVTASEGPPEGASGSGAATVPDEDPREEIYQGPDPGPQGLLPQERLLRRAARPLRRHRLRPGGGAGGGRAGKREGARHLHAFRLHLPALLRLRGEAGGQPRHRHAHPPHRRDWCAPYQVDAPFLAEGGTAAENLQARIRGNLLMAYSNRYGWLVLATGNKSELSMGYCTLYGDMVGGFALIKDLLKRDVYALSRYVNELSGREVIPSEIIERPPSAELRPDQLDTDSLPPYDVLDSILEDYIELGRRVEEIVREGYDRELVLSVIRKVEASEYKRRQGPVGIKLTSRAFGKDWRMPISNPFIKYLMD